MNSLQPGNPADVDSITEVVNKHTPSRQARRDAYQAIMEVINEEAFPN